MSASSECVCGAGQDLCGVPRFFDGVGMGKTEPDGGVDAPGLKFHLCQDRAPVALRAG